MKSYKKEVLLLSVILFLIATQEPFLKKWAYKINVFIQIKLLNHTNTGNVHIGKNNWLFYLTTSDGSSVDDLLGKSSPDIEKKWATYFQKTLSSPLGFTKSKYLFLMPPNKETVYPEKTNYLFLNYVNYDNKNYFHIQKLLENLNPNSVLPLLDLLKINYGFPTYYQSDTHWNNFGCYLAYKEIIKRINLLLDTKIDIPIQNQAPGYSGKKAIQKDILEMFSSSINVLGFSSDPGQDVTIENSFPCCVKTVITDENYTSFENPKFNKVIWFVGDSFSEGLKPYLAPYFKSIIFIKRYVRSKEIFDRALKQSGPPDLIIEEFIERHLKNPPEYFDFTL